MLLRASLLAASLFLLQIFSNPANAESWRYQNIKGFHFAVYTEAEIVTASVSYSPAQRQWFFQLGLRLAEKIHNPTLKFISADGSSRTYSLKPELIDLSPKPEKGLNVARIPIGSKTLELLQSGTSVAYKLGRDEYTIALTGSRAAISRAMELVEHETAMADDEAHAIAQAASDDAQAKAASTGGVRTWEYRGRINDGTKADGYEATASVNDDSMSILYFSADDQFYLWFTYNGNYSFSQKHSHRAEIFIRTKEVSGGGRYDSDYVIAGRTVAQPDRDPAMPQFVVAKLLPEDIRALQQYDGNDIGAGYFVGDDWKTFRFPGKNLWQSFMELAVAVNRRDILQ